ncbi:hypothetical protein [Rodentibacter caecimuris]|uniref:hypothetical protein n=1 Tax=Rodentibacter caecimuris TaxID=1796644 RepID=UPI00101AD26D|nr:hypothetical protein [Rodentibacter heylii]
MKNLLTPTRHHYLASFMIGIGSVLNIGAVYTLPLNVGSIQDDSLNLKKDWQSVGNYLNNSVRKINESRTGSP